jgi:serine/threonine protein kinase
LATICDIGEEDGWRYIITKYIAGKSLKELVLPPYESALRMIQSAALGCHVLHNEGFIHRKINPSNILLDESSRVIVTLAGMIPREGMPFREWKRAVRLARMPSDWLAFAPPELFRGEPLDCRSDVYSLGCTLFQLLTAEPPFPARPRKTLSALPRGKRQILRCRPFEAHSPSIFYLLEKAMEPRREDRFPNAEAMSEAIRDLLRDDRMVEERDWGQEAAYDAYEMPEMDEAGFRDDMPEPHDSWEMPETDEDSEMDEDLWRPSAPPPPPPPRKRRRGNGEDLDDPWAER